MFCQGLELSGAIHLVDIELIRASELVSVRLLIDAGVEGILSLEAQLLVVKTAFIATNEFNTVSKERHYLVVTK